MKQVEDMYIRVCINQILIGSNLYIYLYINYVYLFQVKRTVNTTSAIKFYIRLWIHDHPEEIDLKTFKYGIKMAEKSQDMLYIAELVLSEKSVRKLPLNAAIKHIKKNLENRYFLYIFS